MGGGGGGGLAALHHLCPPPGTKRFVLEATVAFASSGWKWDATVSSVMHLRLRPARRTVSTSVLPWGTCREQLARARAELRHRRQEVFSLSPPKAECDTDQV